MIRVTRASSAFRELRDRFFRLELERYPVISTFLGGDGWDEQLAEANGRLRDASPAAVAEELGIYRAIQHGLDGIDRTALDADDRVDASLIEAQVAFLVHQLADLRSHERAIDTYVAEPFRGIDWQIQQMQAVDPRAADADGLTGTESDWSAVAGRLRFVPSYVETAIANLTRGLETGNTPDARMVRRDGIAGSGANAEYFRSELPSIANAKLGTAGTRARVAREVFEAATAAAAAFDRLATFLEAAAWPADDRFAVGAAEYQWRVTNNLKVDRTPDELWAYGGEQVEEYRQRLFGVAGEIGRARSLGLRFATEAERAAAISAVIRELGRDAPADDDERLEWHVEAGRRAVAYGRDHGLFAVPDDYRLEVVPTPPLLRSTLEAAYYPSAPLKPGGVGRFYLTPTGNDPATLALNGRASIATVAVHEGFPGHDWHYRSMAERGSAIPNVRWLTPGAVEDSSSMWSDSMSIEGWGLYSEELMGEPLEGSPYGFFRVEDEFYYLYWNLRRAMRVRVDVGLHTGRMTYDEAVDWWAANQDFAPDARARAETDATARAILDGADRNIYRYSKWPTQAITYNLGRATIRGLRERFIEDRPGSTPRQFHEWYLGLGTLPAGYLAELI
ncbi:MAG TPA: DUF885 domain-containing protein [Candidatus Limnocylindrales bacterium]